MECSYKTCVFWCIEINGGMRLSRLANRLFSLFLAYTSIISYYWFVWALYRESCGAVMGQSLENWRLRDKTKIIILLIVAFVLLYAPIIVWYFGLSSIYTNPFFRLLEFFIGVIIASLKDVLDRTEFVKKYVYNWIFISFISVLMISGVTIAVKLHIAVNNYMLYSWVCLPCFMGLIIALSGVSFETSREWFRKTCLRLSEMTYCLFLAQLFSNKISQVIIHQYTISSNLTIILLGWSVCIIITIILHEGIEKRVKKYFKRFLLE